jgi:hypothetical protein
VVVAVPKRGTGGGWLAGWEMSERKQHGWEGEKREREKEGTKKLYVFYTVFYTLVSVLCLKLCVQLSLLYL